VDGLGLGADHFDPVPFERAVLVEFHGGVERGLAAERGEQDEFALRPRRFISSFSRTMIFSTHSGVMGSM
jgi:hypothetical protein